MQEKQLVNYSAVKHYFEERVMCLEERMEDKMSSENAIEGASTRIRELKRLIRHFGIKPYVKE